MLVVDASVAIKFVTQEADSEAATALLASDHSLTAPDWVLIECASGLAKKVSHHGLPQADAQERYAALPNFFVRFHPSVELLDQALQLSFDLDHPIYDCLYLASALSDDGLLITADREFVASARRGGFGTCVCLLADWDGSA